MMFQVFFVFTGSFCLEMLWLLSIYLSVMVGKEHFCWRFFNHYPCADGRTQVHGSVEAIDIVLETY